MSIEISAISAFQDNYIWLLLAEGQTSATVVDPGDAEPVIAELEARGLDLDSILITHHHADHTGGLEQLCQRYQPTVYGPENPGIALVDVRVTEGDTVSVQGLEFEVLTVPGHTLDHIAFHTPAGAGRTGALFCGDTLFAGGCGRLFEGSPAQMHTSLQKLAALPADTAVYCAHEYTQANLRFALAAEPQNTAIAQRLEQSGDLLAEQGLTLPSSISLELRTNPFLRCHSEDVRRTVSSTFETTLSADADDVAVFAALRKWKDGFRAPT